MATGNGGEWVEIDLLKLQDKDSKAGLSGEGGLCSSDMFVWEKYV